MKLFVAKTASGAAALALLCAPGAAVAVAATERSEMSSWLGTQFGAVLLLVACGWAVLRFIKQRKGLGGTPAQSLRVVGSSALGGRERVVMLQAGQRVFLLGVTTQQVSLISELDPASPGSLVDPAAFAAQASAPGVSASIPTQTPANAGGAATTSRKAP
jgi:flagellar protein FliO/FliZ